jgi:hypothetical protein
MPALMITALRMRGGSEDDHEHDPEDMDACADKRVQHGIAIQPDLPERPAA